MKLVIAGAFGKLGSDILRQAVKAGHEVVAIDMVTREMDFDGFTAVKVDVTKPEQLNGVCDGADAVISTVGLTRTSATVTNYDIDLNGNLNILAEAKKAGVKKFGYISVLKADKNPDVPMLDAKAKFEKALKESGIEYVIYRPTGYFYDCKQSIWTHKIKIRIKAIKSM